MIRQVVSMTVAALLLAAPAFAGAAPTLVRVGDGYGLQGAQYTVVYGTKHVIPHPHAGEGYAPILVDEPQGTGFAATSPAALNAAIQVPAGS